MANEVDNIQRTVERIVRGFVGIVQPIVNEALSTLRDGEGEAEGGAFFGTFRPQASAEAEPETTPSASYLPARFKTENDNGVRRVRMTGRGSECRTDPMVMVERGFDGPHSLTHALRFAAWLVRQADVSEGHQDFLAVLRAVEEEA